MPSERFFVHKEDGSLVRLKGRLVRFLDEEPPTGSDKSAIRTALEVSPDAEGLVQADVGTDPNQLVLHQHLGDISYQSADSVAMGTVEAESLEVESTTGTATTQALTVTDGTDTNFVVQEDGKTGIGTASPATNLQIQTTGSDAVFSLNRTDAKEYRLYVDSNSQLMFRDQSAGSTRFKITATGDVNVGVGNIVMGTSGKGIDFGSGATLDEYEEGYHETTVGTDGTGSITLYASHDRMTYTKIGNIIQINGMLAITSVSSPTGNVTFSLPVAVPTLTDNAGYVGGAVYFQDYGTSNTTLPFRCVPGTSTMTVYVDASTLAADDKFAFSFTYRTTAS